MLEKLKARIRCPSGRQHEKMIVHKHIRKFLSISLIITLFNVTTASSEDKTNSCIECHSDSAFYITNKKLYKYYQDWELSIHAQEMVTCVDCHGGDPNSTDKEKAHGKEIQQLLTPVKYVQLSMTCGKCHEKNAANYKKSKHYEILMGKKQYSQLTPTCVTCHGSINTSIPKHDNIADICTSCHNPDTQNHPEIPELSGYLIERLAFINYYTRYLISKGVMDENPQFSKSINEEFSELSQIWHRLELDKIEEKTRQIRSMLMERRKELDDK